jgi:hypothetical protein
MKPFAGSLLTNRVIWSLVSSAVVKSSTSVAACIQREMLESYCASCRSGSVAFEEQRRGDWAHLYGEEFGGAAAKISDAKVAFELGYAESDSVSVVPGVAGVRLDLG